MWRTITIIFYVSLIAVCFLWIKKTNILSLKRNSNMVTALKDKKHIANQKNTCRSENREFQLRNPNWKKVGKVEKLYIYPLKSGRGKEMISCDFKVSGISYQNSDCFSVRDRMFLIFDSKTNHFQTARKYPILVLVNLTPVDHHRVKLEAVGMPSFTFAIPEISLEESKKVECTMWFGEVVECIDCGLEPAKWISRFLTGTESGFRLGCTSKKKRSVVGKPWNRFTEVYETLQSEDMGLFSDLASYMLMSESSLQVLNNKLEKSISALQFRPNIIVSGTKPFDEDNWEWIKIGKKAVLRKVKPCSRCSMIRVNPDTGETDPCEPLKTLKSFRELKDQKKIALEGKAPVMGIYCGLYVEGPVNIGDDIYVHVSENSSNSHVLE